MDLTCPNVFHATYTVNSRSGLEVQCKLCIIQHLIQQTAHVTMNKSFLILWCSYMFWLLQVSTQQSVVHYHKHNRQHRNMTPLQKGDSSDIMFVCK